MHADLCISYHEILLLGATYTTLAQANLGVVMGSRLITGTKEQERGYVLFALTRNEIPPIKTTAPYLIGM